MLAATIILCIVSLYASIGVLIGLSFAFRGVHRIDPAATHAPLGFRLLIIPGAAVLWPLVWSMWRSAAQGKAPR